MTGTRQIPPNEIPISQVFVNTLTKMGYTSQQANEMVEMLPRIRNSMENNTFDADAVFRSFNSGTMNDLRRMAAKWMQIVPKSPLLSMLSRDQARQMLDSTVEGPGHSITVRRVDDNSFELKIDGKTQNLPSGGPMQSPQQENRTVITILESANSALLLREALGTPRKVAKRAASMKSVPQVNPHQEEINSTYRTIETELQSLERGNKRTQLAAQIRAWRKENNTLSTNSRTSSSDEEFNNIQAQQRALLEAVRNANR